MFMRFKKKIFLKFMIIAVAFSIYYISNVDTLMNTICNLANNDNFSISKIKVIVFNDFDRYNYLLNKYATQR
ncbi:hypothetical protein SAMN02194393_04831 [Maledivibacter halophilus]|uniref:Uncharacterized protein n=2 Tax=Maledivibacter halophilus TaxID=36842 RepID=A0A1T5MJ43_9FIRM|nr:hypothetical protein SAMN02194393_04831 [Maledivibacter halophilus]